MAVTTQQTIDVVGVIKSVIAAEEAACVQYKKIIKAVDGDDYVTQDMCIRLLADEEGQRNVSSVRGFGFGGPPRRPSWKDLVATPNGGRRRQLACSVSTLLMCTIAQVTLRSSSG